MDGYGYDPFDSLAKLCIVSDSQEDILRRCSFAGDTKSVHAASQSFHFQRTHVSMPYPPERLEQREQTTSRDSYQAPPEQSGGQRPMAVDDPSLQDTVEGGCVSHIAAGVDLGKNKDLGFHLEVQSTEQVAEIEIIGVRTRKVSEFDVDGEADSASKRLKLSNKALGKIEVDLESGRESKLIDESVPAGEESGKVDDGNLYNGEETHLNKNKEQSGEKTVENSQPEEPSNLEGPLRPDPCKRILPLTMNGSKEKAKEKSKRTDDATPSVDSGTPKSIIMEILKILSREETEEDKRLANMSLLEIAMERGMTFPRPCWWPEGEDYSFNKKS